MDWYSWLSKTKLDPSLVYEYSLAFSHNELEEDDIYYLNHEFLQSMGISIAKHRLEILKQAKRNSNFRFPISRLIFAIKRTKRTLIKYIRTLVQGDKKFFLLVSKRSSSSMLSGVMLKSKNKKKKTNGNSYCSQMVIVSWVSAVLGYQQEQIWVSKRSYCSQMVIVSWVSAVLESIAFRVLWCMILVTTLQWIAMMIHTGRPGLRRSSGIVYVPGFEANIVMWFFQGQHLANFYLLFQLKPMFFTSKNCKKE